MRVLSTSSQTATLAVNKARTGWVYILFFFSGFPALLYQIVWQRALFAIYGINIQAVTMIVSAFMLGLGLGSLLGGRLSERKDVPPLRMFGVIELGIGLFGIFSLRIFHFVALFTAGVSTAKAGAFTFTLVLLPTVLMGSTLPILVCYLVQIIGNVGRSVGTLYFVNTLGSAAACFAAVWFTMPRLGESGSVSLAAGINGVIGITILLRSLRSPKEPRPAMPDSSDRDTVNVPVGHSLLSLPVAIFVSGLAGFISLAYEILWYRTYSFVSGGRARAFALLLGFYLVGIAFGSFVARTLCRGAGKNTLAVQLRIVGAFVILANLVGYLVVPFSASIAQNYRPLASLPLVSIATVLLGATLPLISHSALRADSRAGRGLSYLYLSNIIGSTLGSFLVGYVAMDYYDTRHIAVFIALSGLLLGTALLIGSKMSPLQTSFAGVLTAGVAAGVIFSSFPLFDRIYEKLQEKERLTTAYRFKYIVENKSGVVTVTPDDAIYGGGVYDGHFNTSLVNDNNGIFRAYSMGLWHSAPRDVLMIGLSSGSWAQVVANHPQVEHLTVVEINPGYLALIAQYPSVQSLLHNPKVEIVVDDGRRWLTRTPDRKFDAIVMNTSLNWRAHVSNLLSVEFMELARRHLNKSGVLFFNTTGAGESQLTGVTVFPHGLMVANCLAVSDSPIYPDRDRWRRLLEEYRIDGVRVLDLQQSADRQRLEQLVSLPMNRLENPDGLQDTDFIRQRNRGLRIITDDNMGNEWRY